MRLREPEPVVVAEPELHVGTLEMLDRRHDVEQRKLGHGRGMVERQTMAYSRAAIVCDDLEALEAEMRHQLDEVTRHLALGVGCVIGGRWRLQ